MTDLIAIGAALWLNIEKGTLIVLIVLVVVGVAMGAAEVIDWLARWIFGTD